jgi:hypothetical protein
MATTKAATTTITVKRPQRPISFFVWLMTQQNSRHEWLADVAYLAKQRRDAGATSYATYEDIRRDAVRQGADAFHLADLNEAFQLFTRAIAC